VSRRSAQARYQDRDVVVVAGYDRPLNTLFLQVLADDGDASEPEVHYSSLQDPQIDWTDINVVAAKLTELGIDVPGSLLEAVYLDQLFQVGNLVARHHVDRPAEILLAG
jgi:hypothetical protein